MDNVSLIDKRGNLYIKLLCNNINIDIARIVIGYLTSECQICSDKYMPENLLVHDANKCINKECLTYSLITEGFNSGKFIAVEFDYIICKYCASLYGSSVLTGCTRKMYECDNRTKGKEFKRNILYPEKIEKKRKNKKWFCKIIVLTCFLAAGVKLMC